MNKKKKQNFNKKNSQKAKDSERFFLFQELKKWIAGIVIFLIAIIITLSFFGKSGPAGEKILAGLSHLIGRTAFLLPLILFLSALIFFSSKYKKLFYLLLLAFLISVLGISGLLGTFKNGEEMGGILGQFFAFPFLKLFGKLVTQIIFAGIILIAGLIFWILLGGPGLAKRKEEIPKEILPSTETKPSFIKKIFLPRFKVKEVPSLEPEKPEKISPAELKTKPIEPISPVLEKTKISYQPPPLELLEDKKEMPTAADTRINAAIIKKTLQDFDIPVEMSEINIGPTVTQYTFKPAEGVKLSKITALSNDLALALASHPIRIEAPIPGKSLVGIEVPNKVRAQVRLRDLIGSPDFQKFFSNLIIVLGRDVSGNPVFADLSRMPHLLVAGSTGTGKTLFLNSLILSLLYHNSPEILRFILVDPKRVEFPVYNELPHLLSPVIYDVTQTVNALKWLIGEMERRFEILALAKVRDIARYNEKLQEGETPLAYIVLIIDELADLMAAKGKEVEAGIVRLAQMARAVGIHLVVATQRPSVEVITGLIKANITSRVTFQVASQVDSRTVLDMAGAEKLLGLGDLLYLSAEVGKPRRIQGPYVSEKEVKKVVNWLKSQVSSQKIGSGLFENDLAKDLKRDLETPEANLESFYGKEDPLYEEAKRVVIQARKASASFLQRRLQIGYARAARLIDVLEERGIVGPGEGAKPRQVYLPSEEENENNQGWQKI